MREQEQSKSNRREGIGGFPGRSLIIAALAAMLVTAACGPARREAVTEERRDGIRIGPRFIRAPVLRIGLEEKAGSIITLEADGGLILIDRQQGRTLSHKRKTNQVSFFVASGAEEQQAAVYRVQIASLRDKEAARRLAGRVESDLKLKTAVRFSSTTRTWRVQVGEAPSREEAGKVEAILKKGGYDETWVLKEAREAAEAGELAAVDSGGEKIAQARSFACIPAREGDVVKLGSASYRGAIELRARADGLALPVNIINIEEYLRGVVPAELSPTAFPQLEAQKAQAVAARTYAYKNRNQYAAEGYDICESARCQVYAGAGAEHELSDRAVRETAGEIATYDSEPINALFTSTCGGHTEDVENVFPGEGPPAPYLRGVLCEPELELLSHLESAELPPVTYGDDGRPIDFEIAALRLAGVLPADFWPGPAEAVSASQWRAWAGGVARRLGRASEPQSGLQETPSLAAAVDYLVAALDWGGRITRHVSEGDILLLADFEGAESLDGAGARRLLYFLRQRLVNTEPDGRLAFDEPLRQTKAIRMLYSVLKMEGALGEMQGRLMRAENAEIIVHAGEERRRFRTGGDIRLFKSFQGFTVPVRSLQMVPGDSLVLLLEGDEVWAIAHQPSYAGVASDRSSRFHLWDVRLTPAKLEETVARRSDVGEIVDLRPLRYGVSERIVELEVEGSKGTAVFKGLQVRWALGLRENLFVVEREYDDGGRVKAWRFIGRGWGHGVGLCQVGASGMALAGKSYREILRHYYSGIEINKLY